jgi:hypothetical protein
MKKHIETLRIAFTLIMARTFGEYMHSGWTEFDYAKYKWRGREWCIPLSPYEVRELRDHKGNVRLSA